MKTVNCSKHEMKMLVKNDFSSAIFKSNNLAEHLRITKGGHSE
jgi:hypothetical protein